VINTVANCAQVRGCLSAGCGIIYDSATGQIRADLSFNAGNALQCLPDGLFVAAGASTVTTGCGINGNGSPADPVRVDAGTWPYACAIGANGGVVACDPATGQLYSEPRSRSVMSTVNEVQAFANVPVPTGAPVAVRTIDGDFTNPDPCRSATVIIERELEFDVTLPVGARVTYGFTGDDMVNYTNRGTATHAGFAIQVTKVLNAGTIGPGATVNYSWDAMIGNGTNGATYANVQQIIRVMFVTA
jgi:hypothetical protein